MTDTPNTPNADVQERIRALAMLACPAGKPVIAAALGNLLGGAIVYMFRRREVA